MAYLVIYSKLQLPREPLGVNPPSRESGVYKAGPFHTETEAINEACRIQREMPTYQTEIWRDEVRLFDNAKLQALCRPVS